MSPRAWPGLLALPLAMTTACTTAPALRQSESPVAQARPGAELAAPQVWGARATRARGADVVLTAMNFIDQPYRLGGHSAERGFDCSGFTRHVYAQSLGLALPRQADEQAQAAGLQPITREELRAGDLVFFNTLRRTFSHVGIYVGDGRFIHAPRSGAQVRIESITAPYWSRRFTGARRADVLILGS